MKRGLKGVVENRMALATIGSNLCPDEKGTESISNFLLYLGNLSSNLCPDEKGTESRTPVVSCQWLVKACTDKVQYAQVFASGGMVRVKLCHGAYC